MGEPSPSPRYSLSSGALARRYSCSRRTIERLAKAGILPCLKIKTAKSIRYLFDPEEIKKAVAFRPKL